MRLTPWKRERHASFSEHNQNKGVRKTHWHGKNKCMQKSALIKISAHLYQWNRDDSAEDDPVSVRFIIMGGINIQNKKVNLYINVCIDKHNKCLPIRYFFFAIFKGEREVWKFNKKKVSSTYITLKEKVEHSTAHKQQMKICLNCKHNSGETATMQEICSLCLKTRFVSKWTKWTACCSSARALLSAATSCHEEVSKVVTDSQLPPFFWTKK